MSPKKKISYLTEQSNYLKEQKNYVDKLSSSKNGFGFVSLGELVQSLRSMGYNNTFKAIAELLDNSIEALASHIIIAFKKTGRNTHYNSTHVGGIAIIDDGYGMEPEMLRAALRYGGTHRYNSRTGIGRFGMGLPGACGSLSGHYTLYAKLDDNELHGVDVSLHDIVKKSYEGDDILVPKAKKSKLPNWIGNIITMDRNGKDTKVHDYLHGTVINLDSPDKLSAGYVYPTKFVENMTQEIGITYRNYLQNNRISIVEFDERTNSYSELREVQPIDPLFLREEARFYTVDENEYVAEKYKGVQFKMKGKDGKQYPVTIRYSLLHPGFRRAQYTGKLVKARSEIMNRNKGALTLTRAGRQMSVVRTMRFPKKSNNISIQNNDAFWNVEVDFHPGLDEVFFVPANKQSASPSNEAWTQFEKHDMPKNIREMRNRYEKLAAPYKAKLTAYKEGIDPEHEHDTVSNIIKVARKKEIKTGRSEEVTEAIANKRVTVRKQLEENGQSDIDIENLIEDVDLDYQFREEERPESPFYRVELDGDTGNAVIYLNTAHLFYQDLYANVNLAQRDALKLLIYSLADTELNSSTHGRLWYKSHRPLWSEKLSQTLADHKKRYADNDGSARIMDMTAKEVKKAAKARA